MIFYVRNMSLNVTEADLRAVFEPLGEIASVTLLKDGKTGRPLGVGVVNMPDAHEVLPVTKALVGVQIDGRAINVGEPRLGSRRQNNERRSNGRPGSDRRSTDRRVVTAKPRMASRRESVSAAR